MLDLSSQNKAYTVIEKVLCTACVTGGNSGVREEVGDRDVPPKFIHISNAYKTYKYIIY